MPSPDTPPVDDLSLTELRVFVDVLVGEVRRLQADNAALRAEVEAQRATITALRTENQALRDEVARLKGLPPRLPSRPSGMEKATEPGATGTSRKRSRRRRGPKCDRDAITAERVLKATVPAGSRFKSYEDYLVRELHRAAEVIRYRRERWLTPAGETVVAPLPAGTVGGFGPELRRFVLALHAQGQVTAERLTALLEGIGMAISKRQVVRLLSAPLDDLVAEDEAVMRAGLATARWITVDDTSARHARKEGVTTQLGIDQLKVTPDPVLIASEGVLWGAIHYHGLLSGTVIVSDDAGQFRVGSHALCWVHAERLVHKLVPATAEQRRAVEVTRELIWWLYADLKAWKRDPCPRRAAALRARFDRIFRRRTGYVVLDRLLARLHRRKDELLRVLQHPEIPLHTNGSENDIRACVTKRKISGGTMSTAGRTARDVLLGLMKTCRKLGVSFYGYLGARLHVPGAAAVPPLPDLVRQAASTA
jgi:hypothetical protein